VLSVLFSAGIYIQDSDSPDPGLFLLEWDTTLIAALLSVGISAGRLFVNHAIHHPARARFSSGTELETIESLNEANEEIGQIKGSTL
jgi:hypothetical protein